jgi:hypothetical protein
MRNYLADVGPVDNEICVFDLLQRSRTTKVGATALQLTLNALLDGLPQPIQEKVSLYVGAREGDHDTSPPIGQSDWFAQDNEAFENTVADLEDGSLPPLKFNNKEFTLWVVDAGTPNQQHYVTIVLHYEPSNPRKPKLLDHIGHWAVVDALDNEDNTSLAQSRTSARVKRLFRRHNIDPTLEQTTWVPPQRKGEEFASGLLAYAVVAQLLDRIGIMHCSGGHFDEEAFFSPTRPWFNADAVRAEMFGRTAIKAMEKLRWKARLVLLPITSFTDDQRKSVDPGELAPSQVPPAAHNIPSGKDSSSEGEAKNNTIQANQAKQQRDSAFRGSKPAPNSGNQDDNTGHTIDEDSPEIQWYLNRKQKDIERAQEQVQKATEAAFQAATFADTLQMEVLNAPDNNVPANWAIEKLRGLLHRAQALHKSAKHLIDVVAADYHPVFHAVVSDRLEQRRALAELEEHCRVNSSTLDHAVEIFLEAVAARGDRGGDEQMAEVQTGHEKRPRKRLLSSR